LSHESFGILEVDKNHFILIMKTGRPSHHTPIKWIKVALPDGRIYLKLDQKGNLIDKDAEAQRFALNTFPTQPNVPIVPIVSVPQPGTPPIIKEEDFVGYEGEVPTFDYEW
jgi:hypothetical protein